MEALIIAFWMFLTGFEPSDNNLYPSTTTTIEEENIYTPEPQSAGGGNIKVLDVDGL
jgi:hypothetical protein